LRQAICIFGNIRGANPIAVPSNYMSPGSLTRGSTDVNYGYNTGWTTNTAALMLE
jgi:hypothetical protein